MEEKGMELFEPSDPVDPTLGTYGLVLRMNIDQIPPLKRYLSHVGARIVYQRLSGGKLWIKEGEEP